MSVLKEVLIGCAKRNEVQTGKRIIDLFGADVRFDENKLLRVASRYGKLEFVQMLVERGAGIHDRNDEAIRNSYKHGHADVSAFFEMVVADEAKNKQ